MTANEPGAGTTEVNTSADGNPATSETPSETPEEAIARLKDENAKLQAAREQDLAEKTAHEATKREYEALRAQLGNRPPEPANDPRDALRQTIQRIAEIAADPHDPYRFIAQGQLVQFQAQEQQNRAWAEDQALARIPEADRENAKTFFNQNRERFADPEVAYWAMLGKRGPSQEDKAKREAEEASRRRDAAPGMPSTISTPGTNPAGGVMRMKRADYNALAASGREDLITMKDTGKLILTD